MRALVASVIAIVLINISFLSFQPLPPFQPLLAQSGDRGATDAMARRVNDRVRALQAEADRLALQVRTLLGDLRQLELRRDIAAEEEKTATAAVTQAQRGLEQSTARLNALEQQRISQLPDLK